MNYDQIVSDGFSAIEELIEKEQEESYRLDFKEKSDASRPNIQRDDKKGLGESASGFANANGGLLIIGIKTINSNGVDRANKIVPIVSVLEVVERYKSYLSECASPPVKDIRIAAISEPGKSSGVIAIEIPKSDERPHMSVAPGHHRFYRRTADRFQIMERYEVEEMFAVRTSPRLELALKYSEGGITGGHKKSYILFGLTNNSNVTAKYPYISIQQMNEGPKVAEYGLDGNGRTLFSKIVGSAPNEAIFAAGSDIVIHPGQSLFVSKLEYVHTTDEKFRSYWSPDHFLDDERCQIEFAFGCDDHPRETKLFHFSKLDLVNHVVPDEVQ